MVLKWDFPEKCRRLGRIPPDAFPLSSPKYWTKEPILTAIWLSHVLVAGLGYDLCRRHWRWLLAMVPLSTYAVWFGAIDLWDKSVGPAILEERVPSSPINTREVSYNIKYFLDDAPGKPDFLLSYW